MAADVKKVEDRLAESSAASSQSVAFKNSPTPERVVFVSPIIAALLFLQADSLNLVSRNIIGLGILLVSLLNFLFVIYRYRSEPMLASRPRLRLKLKEINDQIKAAEGKSKAAEQERAVVVSQHTREKARIEATRRAVEAEEQEEIEACQRSLQPALSSVNRLRRSLNQKAADALQEIQNATAAKVIALNRQIEALARAEAEEVASTLRATQAQFIAAYLQRFALADAPINNIGPQFKSRLMRGGYHTAADIEADRIRQVKRIGQSRAVALAAWRDSIELKARAKMPQALSQSELAAIKTKYEWQRLLLEERRDQEQRLLVAKEAPTRKQYQNLLDLLDVEESYARMRLKLEVEGIGAKYAPQHRALGDALSKLTRETELMISEIDERIGAARQEMLGLEREKKKISQQLKRLESIRFSSYAKRLFFGSRGLSEMPQNADGG